MANKKQREKALQAAKQDWLNTAANKDKREKRAAREAKRVWA